MLKGAKKIAFSIIELAFAFVALSIALAALAPIISKKMTPTAKTTTSDDSIKTTACFDSNSQFWVSEYCVACVPVDNPEENSGKNAKCVECLMEESDCEEGKKLDTELCDCVDES